MSTHHHEYIDLEILLEQKMVLQRNVLRGRWRHVYPIRCPSWWQRLFGHRHHHEMTFPRGGLDWVFVCKCGHTTTDINEATP